MSFKVKTIVTIYCIDLCQTTPVQSWTVYFRYADVLRDSEKTWQPCCTAKTTYGIRLVADAKTLSTVAVFVVYFTADYCIPVSCRNAHTRIIDRKDFDALHVFNGCQRSTLAHCLPILAVFNLIGFVA